MTSNGLPCAVLCSISIAKGASTRLRRHCASSDTPASSNSPPSTFALPHQSSRTCRGAEPRAARELDDLDCSRTPEGVADIQRRWQCPARTWIGSTYAAYSYTTTPHPSRIQLLWSPCSAHYTPVHKALIVCQIRDPARLFMRSRPSVVRVQVAATITPRGVFTSVTTPC